MSIVGRLTRIIARQPQTVAVEGTWASRTYVELSQRADHVARKLSGLGVGVESIVALCAAPGLDTIAAMLGVLRAGAAFLPIDPDYPEERVAAMLQTAGPGAVLADDRLLGWSALAGWDRIGLREAAADDPAAPPRCWLEPAADAAAYVVFTSGSTGHPKGVVVPHRGLLAMVDEQIRAFGISRASRVLQFASLSFDASVSEVFTALCAGATLCLVENPADRHGMALLDTLERRRLSVVTLPPSLLRVLPARDLPDLATLVSAGEACGPDIARRWYRPGRRLVNAYGPSEATVCATMKVLAGPEDHPVIGLPLRGVRAEVLDAGLGPVADGAPGELFLGGDGLARGYAGDPSRTAERFVPAPFPGPPGARAYRTGDIVTRAAGGELDFVGRGDDQAKVRGFRVEPGEIEAALRPVVGVRDVRVLVHERAGGATLVAHVVGDPAIEDVLREACRRRLPAFLQPSAYRFLEAWPLTPSGKLDAAALRRSGDAPAAAGDDREQSGPTGRLSRLFGELLEVGPLDPGRSFFDAGGDSILAIRLLLRIEAELGRRVRLGALLDHPTPSELARLIEGPPAHAAAGPIRLRATGDRLPLWLVAPVHGNPLCYLPLARRFPAGRPLLGLQAPGLEAGDPPPPVDFEALARAQVDLLRRSQPEGPYLLAGWSLGGTLAFEMALELARQGQDVPLVALIAATAPSPDHIAAARETMADYAPWRICFMLGRSLALASGAAVELDLDELRDRPPEAAYRLLARRLDGVGPISRDTPLEELERWVQVFRAALRGFHHYQPRGRPAGRFLVVTPRAPNPFLTRDRFVTHHVPAGDWGDFVEGPIDRESIGGDHYGLMSSPWVEELGGALSAWIDAHEPSPRRPET